MPPKPAAKDAGAGDGDGPDPALEEEKELVERELVIGHLYTRLARYQARGRVLASTNLELIDELDTQKINLKDINEFLTSELRSKELATSEMEARVARLAGELDDLRDVGATRVRGVEEQAREQQAEPRAALLGIEKELKELDLFSAKRDGLDMELGDKEAMLERQRDAHAARLEDIARKSSSEKDRLKKELAIRIKDTKANMKKMTDAQLEGTTRRTIIENEQMGSELVFQARQTDKLLDRNETLAAEHARMASDLDEARGTEAELAKRNHVYQKTIRTLTQKLGTQEEAVRFDQAAMARGEGELKVLTARLHAVRRERDAVVGECEAAAHDRDGAAAEVAAAAAAAAQCVRFLEQCAADVDERMHAARAAHETAGEAEVLMQPGRLEELSLVQRRRALDYLLDKVHGGGGGGGEGVSGSLRCLSDLFVGGGGGGGSGGGGRGLAGAGPSGAPSMSLLPPIRPTGGGSFTNGIGADTRGEVSEGVGGGGGGGWGGDYGYGGNGGGSGSGGGRGKVEAAVQTAPSAEAPALWQEAAAAGGVHVAAAAVPPPRAKAAGRGRVPTVSGAGSGFNSTGLKLSYNFTPRRK